MIEKTAETLEWFLKNIESRTVSFVGNGIIEEGYGVHKSLNDAGLSPENGWMPLGPIVPVGRLAAATVIRWDGGEQDGL